MVQLRRNAKQARANTAQFRGSQLTPRSGATMYPASEKTKNGAPADRQVRGAGIAGAPEKQGVGTPSGSTIRQRRRMPSRLGKRVSGAPSDRPRPRVAAGCLAARTPVRLFATIATISGGKRHPPSASIAVEVHRVVADQAGFRGVLPLVRGFCGDRDHVALGQMMAHPAGTLWWRQPVQTLPDTLDGASI